jgi:lipopolysaccharide biosynthesis regulator YciM
MLCDGLQVSERARKNGSNINGRTILMRKTVALGENVIKCHFTHHKSHSQCPGCREKVVTNHLTAQIIHTASYP